MPGKRANLINLTEERPIQVRPTVVKALGYNEAVLLERVWSRLQLSGRTEEHDGRRFVLFPPRAMARELPCLSRTELYRTRDRLRDELGILVQARLKDTGNDATSWYAVDTGALRRALARVKGGRLWKVAEPLQPTPKPTAPTSPNLGPVDPPKPVPSWDCNQSHLGTAPQYKDLREETELRQTDAGGRDVGDDQATPRAVAVLVELGMSMAEARDHVAQYPDGALRFLASAQNALRLRDMGYPFTSIVGWVVTDARKGATRVKGDAELQRIVEHALHGGALHVNRTSALTKERISKAMEDVR